MQENTSNGFGSISPWSWNDDGANNSFASYAFSLDNPHQQLFLPTKDDVANNSSDEDFSRPIPDAASCYALSLDNLHQRLLWVETAVLGWQLERNHQSIPPTFNEAGGCDNSGKIILAPTPASLRENNLARRNAPREFTNARIIAERRRGQGKQYQVLWDGGDLNDSTWLSGTALKVKGSIALAKWEKQKQLILSQPVVGLIDWF
ncbi:hypothetical protein B0H14DRAFT_2629325 [Mycena olivaceomarginata]|nr:hypothetical protein B0H14DRAFT_2629325 [Mycena olivaceomarginata]